jgi:thiosulfate/3-mercaptopyruvate sulfurtransferase
VYDDGPGFFAARVWWLLYWLGHPQVRVLDGGLSAWEKAGLPLSAAQSVKTWPGDFVASVHPDMVVTADKIEQALPSPEFCLIDARAPARFRGEVEPIDPVAGHIPGAVCLPCSDNIGGDGLFLSPELLARRFPKEHRPMVCYCGSGVTACHNILAAVVAGLPMPRLYAGSWSEWITDPARPVATDD